MDHSMLTGYPYGFVEEDWFRLREQSFKESIQPQYRKLINGLSDESIAEIDMYLARLKRIPYQAPRVQACCNYGELLHSDITPWDLEQLQAIHQFDCNTYYKMLNIPEGVPCVIPASLYHNGLKLLSRDDLRTVVGRDIIDGGAYLGESAFMFAQYAPKKIYAFEPDPNRCQQMRGFFDQSLTPELFECVCAGIGEKDGFASLSENGAGSTMNTDLAGDDSSGQPQLQVCSIDSFVQKNNLDVGCIKLDIEGMELEAMHGAAQTIATCRPVLLISIYHTAKDFFGVKPFIESIADDYRFMVYHLDAREMLIEYMLIGIPERIK